MAGSAVFTVVIINFVISLTYFSAFGYSEQDLDELLVSREALESRIENSTSEWPVCIFYKNPGVSSQLEKGFVNFLKSLPKGNFVSNWTIVAFNVDKVCGFKAPSPLLKLPSFDIVNGIAIDAMHCGYLGVVKQLVGLWFNSKHSGEKWYCGNSVEKVDKRLLEIKPPSVITRIPRSIQHHVKFWKATEYRNWLFYYSLPCMKGVLDDEYYQHYALLVGSIFLLSGRSISPEQMEMAGKCLMHFVEMFDAYYGKRYVLMNHHMLLHLKKNVSDHGPLWCSSLFIFEDWNGDISNYFHGTQNIAHQGLLHWNGHPGMVPLLQCHTWTADSPLTFMSREPPPSSQSFYNWFKHVGRVFAKRLQLVASDNLPDVISSHAGHTVVVLPGHLFHQALEKTLKQVAKRWKGKIKVLIAIPLTAEENYMMHEFNVSQLPAVIIFTSLAWSEERKPISLLQGVEEVTERGIEILLVTLHSQAVHLTQDNFFEEIMETSHPHPPVAVCCYSPRNPRTLNYLDAFHRSLETFGKMELLLRFKLLNIITHPQVIPRYVNATEVHSVPFTVVFWQETITGTQRFEIKQRVFDKDIPTPMLFFEFLQSLSMKLQFIAEDDGELFNPWKPSDDSKNVCGRERWKNTCSLDDNSTSEHKTALEHRKVMYGHQLTYPSWTVTVQHQTNKQIHQIPYVNDKIWASLIEQSVAPTTSYASLPVQQQQQQSSSLFSVNVVVFIAHGCGYCVKVMPLIEKISKAVTYVGASLYVHNCTSDPQTCRRYSITGYPTLTAFRSLSWFTVERCSRSRTSSLRLDYHGPVVPKLVLEWVSNISQPAVNRRFLFDSPPDMDVDVRLIGTIYTRSLARRYLPTSVANTWYPFRCFQLICELLFGRVPCYMIYTRDVSDDGSKRNAKDQDLLLSKLELQRRDGVRAKVFQLGQNVETTINNQRDSRLHMFHETHRYNLPKLFRCEHDHKLCTDVAVRFVLEHRRLPVVHMTSEAFHIKLGSEEEASYEPFGHDLPILVALVHKANVSSGSSFYKELTEAAYALYRDIVTVTVDVDEFAYWTSNFVPIGYHSKHGFGRRSETLPSLYHYPRLCIIQHDDHGHAAFYPPVGELQAMGTSVQARLDLINGQQIIKFARDYLKDPEGSLVKTEEF